MSDITAHQIIVTDEDRKRWRKRRRGGTNGRKCIDEHVVKGALPWYIEHGIKPTLRAIYYRLVSLKIIPNTKSAYGSLSDNVVLARQENRIEWDAISDSVRLSVVL